MAFIIPAGFNPWRRKCAISDPELHSRVNDFNDNDHSNNQRDRPNQGLWRRLQECQRQQCDPEQRHQRGGHNLHGDRHHKAVQPRGCDQERRNCGANGHHKDHHHELHYKQLIRVFAVIFCFCLPVRAEGGGTTAIANPVATSSGSVSNQAVQINQGSYSQQGYGNGHTCNSSTLVLTPFYLGNDVNNPEAAYIRNQNFGAQVSLSIPLDFEMVRLCKDLAKRKLEKERLDYELVRILKCVEIKKAGYMIHPSSPYAGVCADVIPIAAARK